MTRVHTLFGALALSAALIAVPTASYAGVFVGIGVGFGVGVSVDVAPPPLPVYVQPPCQVADTIWVPGYWAYGEYGYYWVPGTWLAAPQVGYLWTPGYWGYGTGAYAWHPGYWGPHVGFYGGVNYGFGYGGFGYAGGSWSGDHVAYNTAVTNINRTTINNVYVNRTVINNYGNGSVTRVSYNGGPGGIARQPAPDEVAYRGEPHLALTAAQKQHIETAAQNRNFLASVNRGAPARAAFARPLNAQNRPAGFVSPTSADRVPAGMGTTAASRPNGTTTVDPWSRFNHSVQTAHVNGASSPNANRFEPSYATHGATFPQATRSNDEAGPSHEPGAPRAPGASHPGNGNFENTYQPSRMYHTPNTYHAPNQYHAPNAYHARPSGASTYRGPGATQQHPHPAPHAPPAHPGGEHEPHHH